MSSQHEEEQYEVEDQEIARSPEQVNSAMVTLTTTIQKPHQEEQMLAEQQRLQDNVTDDTASKQEAAISNNNHEGANPAEIISNMGTSEFESSQQSNCFQEEAVDAYKPECSLEYTQNQDSIVPEPQMIKRSAIVESSNQWGHETTKISKMNGMTTYVRSKSSQQPTTSSAAKSKVQHMMQ